MAQKKYFRCNNDMGSDPCNWAKEGREIPEDDAKRCMDGDGWCCQGTTDSGQTCGKKLEERKGKIKSGNGSLLGGLSPRIVIVIAIIIAAVALGLVGWWTIYDGGDGGGKTLPKISVVSPTPPAPVVFTVVAGFSEKIDRTVKIRNDGNKQVEVKLSVAPNSFAVKPTSVGIAAQEIQEITVTYQPTPGERPKGTLKVEGQKAQLGEVQLEVKVDETKAIKDFLDKLQNRLNQGGQQ